MHAPTMVRDLRELRNYVEEIICDQNELEPRAFRMTERPLLRHGKPCGIYFCLHGPRSVKLIAIWESDQNTVLFYGSNGERTLRCRLPMAPRHAFAAA